LKPADYLLAAVYVVVILAVLAMAAALIFQLAHPNCPRNNMGNCTSMMLMG
jgi:hypothetical protein